MTRREYYVNLHASEISETPNEGKKHFTIYATNDEVRLLRAKMENMYDEDLNSFWRAHVPFMPYDRNNPSDQYDAEMMEAFAMIYHLGDEKAQADIEQMNILDDESKENFQM